MANSDFDGTLDYYEYNRLHPDPLDETDRDGGALEDANDDAMDKWARHYDDLNGAPESDEDR